MALMSTPNHSAQHENIAQLVMQAQQDPASFGPLYNHYVKPVYRYLYNRVGNKQDAEDLAAQTFLSALQALPGYRDRGHFSAWLFSIARNKVIDYFRSHRREIVMENPGGWAELPDIGEKVVRTLEAQRLSALISRLRESEKELIRLRYIADLTFAEIAKVLGKKEDAVKKTLYRLLARLENQMEVENE